MDVHHHDAFFSYENIVAEASDDPVIDCDNEMDGKEHIHAQGEFDPNRVSQMLRILHRSNES